MLDIGCRVLSNVPLDLDVVGRCYDLIKASIPPTYRFIIHAPLQMAENMTTRPMQGQPWDLEGNFVSRTDLETFKTLPMHVAITYALRLRLAVYYDAPDDILDDLVEKGSQGIVGVDGLVFDLEWSFLTTIWAIRRGRQDWQKSSRYQDLQRHAKSRWPPKFPPTDKQVLTFSIGCLAWKVYRLCRRIF